MGVNTDVTVRATEELNTNRIGPLTCIYAIVDKDRAGNEVLLQIANPSGGGLSQYCICSDERAQSAFFEVAKVLIKSSRRNLRVVKLSSVTDVEL